MEDVALLQKAALWALIVMAIVLSLVGVAVNSWNWGGLLLNLGTEMAGAALTYGLFGLVVGSMERRESKKADLITQLRSDVEERVTVALEELQRQGWLYDGSLQGANLQTANLQEKDLSAANLQRVNLQGSRLQKAKLLYAKLQGADLTDANLEGAILQLMDPEPPNEVIASVEFDKNTILPDGTRWTPDIDMSRLTSKKVFEFGYA